MGSDLQLHAIDLLWSLWTELGVPGLTRRHEHVAIDPEPLIVASPWIAEGDARLRDEVHRWCAAHADRISVSRLQGLLRRATPEVRGAFGQLAATLAVSSGARWPTAPEDVPWPRAPDPRPPALPTTRPSLARLRVRALAGVGARADVVAELLGRTAVWTTASDLDTLGYSKRNVARVLSELADAGLARELADGNARTFQLDCGEAWTRLLHVEEVGWPHWDAVMRLVIALLSLAGIERRPATVRRVEAAKVSEVLRPLAATLGLAAPPAPRGDPEIDARLRAWAAEQAGALADGTSVAFRVRATHEERVSAS